MSVACCMPRWWGKSGPRKSDLRSQSAGAVLGHVGTGKSMGKYACHTYMLLYMFDVLKSLSCSSFLPKKASGVNCNIIDFAIKIPQKNWSSYVCKLYVLVYSNRQDSPFPMAQVRILTEKLQEVGGAARRTRRIMRWTTNVNLSIDHSAYVYDVCIYLYIYIYSTLFIIIYFYAVIYAILFTIHFTMHIFISKSYL